MDEKTQSKSKKAVTCFLELSKMDAEIKVLTASFTIYDIELLELTGFTYYETIRMEEREE